MNVIEQLGVIEAARFYYIYSFAFSRLPLREEISCNGEEQLLGAYLSEYLRKLLGNHYKSALWHESEEEEPCESRAALYTPFHHISISSHWASVRADYLGESKLRAHIAVFESGMGVVWLEVAPNSPPSVDLTCRASGRRNLPRLLSDEVIGQDKPDTETLHDVFSAEITSLHKCINDGLSHLDGESRRMLARKYSTATWTSPKATDATLESTPDEFTVSWLDMDGDLVWHDKSGDEERLEAFQEPDISVFLKVDKEVRDTIDLDAQNRTHVEQLVSMILHASTLEVLDASHSYEHSAERLRNLYPDRRFRTFLHANCLLVLHAEDSQSSEDDLTRFARGLFRTFCAVRGAWHVYSIANEHLYRTIQRLLAEASDTSPGARGVGLEDIIKAKSFFLSCLSTEDPLTWGVGLTSFSSIHDAARRSHNLSNLRQSVQSRLHELDRLFDMVRSLQYQRRGQDMVGLSYGRNWVYLGIGVVLLAGAAFGEQLLGPIITSPLVKAIVRITMILIGTVVLLSSRLSKGKKTQDSLVR